MSITCLYYLTIIGCSYSQCDLSASDVGTMAMIENCKIYGTVKWGYKGHQGYKGQISGKSLEGSGSG